MTLFQLTYDQIKIIHNQLKRFKFMIKDSVLPIASCIQITTKKDKLVFEFASSDYAGGVEFPFPCPFEAKVCINYLEFESLLSTFKKSDDLTYSLLLDLEAGAHNVIFIVSNDQYKILEYGFNILLVDNLTKKIAELPSVPFDFDTSIGDTSLDSDVISKIFSLHKLSSERENIEILTNRVYINNDYFVSFNSSRQMYMITKNELVNIDKMVVMHTKFMEYIIGSSRQSKFGILDNNTIVITDCKEGEFRSYVGHIDKNRSIDSSVILSVVEDSKQRVYTANKEELLQALKRNFSISKIRGLAPVADINFFFNGITVTALTIKETINCTTNQSITCSSCVVEIEPKILYDAIGAFKDCESINLMVNENAIVVTDDSDSAFTIIEAGVRYIE